jgi:hypothetical protein
MAITTKPIPTLTISELNELTSHITSGAGTDTIDWGGSTMWSTTGTVTPGYGAAIPGGSNGYTYTTNTTSPWISGSNNATVNIAQSGTLELRGENPDIKINDKSMVAWMEKVEERLNIMTPNPELEADWDELQALGERYRALEKQCQEKAQMWAKLKQVQTQQL